MLTYRHLKIWNKLSDDIVKYNSNISFKIKINTFDFSPTCFLIGICKSNYYLFVLLKFHFPSKP